VLGNRPANGVVTTGQSGIVGPPITRSR